jgi:hypothetical protein
MNAVEIEEAISPLPATVAFVAQQFITQRNSFDRATSR